LLHADFSQIVLKYSNEVHLLRYLTPLDEGDGGDEGDGCDDEGDSNGDNGGDDEGDDGWLW
jgi:hypothetical protein